MTSNRTHESIHTNTTTGTSVAREKQIEDYELLLNMLMSAKDKTKAGEIAITTILAFLARLQSD